MIVRVGVDGFGPIGRTYPHAVLDQADAGIEDVEVVVADALSSPVMLAHLLGCGSEFGRIGRDVRDDDSSITVDASPSRPSVIRPSCVGPDGERLDGAPGRGRASSAERAPRCAGGAGAEQPRSAFAQAM
ncbi:hypothetical protein ACGFRG_24265 [Streptomyces sp. NPDC048696]|uniref:hypothetical protein n=1 Tax=Streptomyces sp. NPDC048696 TaxID=3365585 RepID=UPI00372098CC